MSALTISLFKLSVWLLLLGVVFVPLERLVALRPQKVFRDAFITDLAYYFINSLLPKIILILPLSAMAWALHCFMPAAALSWITTIPFFARFAAAMIIGEIGAYWGHRMMHEIPILWRFHSVHHSAEEIDWLVNTRGHPLDFVFTRLCGLLPIYMLGLAQPTGDTPDLVPMLYAIIGTTWSFFVHANVRWRFGWLELFLSTPAFHHWHHTKGDPDHINKNFSAILPFVDRLFGTYFLPTKIWPMKYGIHTPMAPDLAGQLLQPFSHR